MRKFFFIIFSLIKISFAYENVIYVNKNYYGKSDGSHDSPFIDLEIIYELKNQTKIYILSNNSSFILEKTIYLNQNLSIESLGHNVLFVKNSNFEIDHLFLKIIGFSTTIEVSIELKSVFIIKNQGSLLFQV